MITCMETSFPSPCTELNDATKTLRTEMSPNHQSYGVQQLVQTPQSVVSGTGKGRVGKLNMAAD